MMISNKPLPKWLRKVREELLVDYDRDPEGFLDRMKKTVAAARDARLLNKR